MVFFNRRDAEGAEKGKRKRKRKSFRKVIVDCIKQHSEDRSSRGKMVQIVLDE
jgi:hypothetical protein